MTKTYPLAKEVPLRGANYNKHFEGKYLKMITKKKNSTGSVVINGKVVNKELRLAVGIDVGSTQTRVSMADIDDVKLFNEEDIKKSTVDLLRKTYIIPSAAGILEGDNREIVPYSDNLEDNYDSQLILVNSKAEIPMFNSVRVLRGRKIDDTKGVTIRYFDSSSQKFDNQLFYLNIIDSIGYALMQKYNNKGIPNKVKIDLVISVRPKERSKIARDKMTEQLLSKTIFKWCNNEIEIIIENLGFTTEPEAQINGTDTVYSAAASANIEGMADKIELFDQIQNCSTYMHIEGGGSSIGVEIVKDGTIVNSASTTFPIGGNYLNQVISDRVQEELGIVTTISSVAKAVHTGMLKDGRSDIDISNVIATCKSQLANSIFEDVKHRVIDTQPDIVLRNIEIITLGGRLFKKDTMGQSIATYFEMYVKQDSTNTDVLYLEDNLIPQGNMTTALYEFSENWSIEDEEDENYSEI